MEESLQSIATILFATKWRCLRLRIVLQVSLTEMIGIYLSMKLKMFWHDNTARLEGRNKKLPKIVGKVPKMMRMEVVEKDVQLSITEGGKEGKSKAIASCRHLEDKCQEHNQKRRSRHCRQRRDTNDDFEDEIKASMKEREDEKEEVRCKILHCQEEARAEELYEDWRNEITEGGFGPSESEVKTSLGTSSTERLKLRRQMTTEASKRESVQSSLFLQVDTLLIEGHMRVILLPAGYEEDASEQKRIEYWEKWTVQHKREELKGGV